MTDLLCVIEAFMTSHIKARNNCKKVQHRNQMDLHVGINQERLTLSLQKNSKKEFKSQLVTSQS